MSSTTTLGNKRCTKSYARSGDTVDENYLKEFNKFDLEMSELMNLINDIKKNDKEKGDIWYHYPLGSNHIKLSSTKRR